MLKLRIGITRTLHFRLARVDQWFQSEFCCILFMSVACRSKSFSVPTKFYPSRFTSNLIASLHTWIFFSNVTLDYAKIFHTTDPCLSYSDLFYASECMEETSIATEIPRVCSLRWLNDFPTPAIQRVEPSSRQTRTIHTLATAVYRSPNGLRWPSCSSMFLWIQGVLSHWWIAHNIQWWSKD